MALASNLPDPMRGDPRKTRKVKARDLKRGMTVLMARGRRTVDTIRAIRPMQGRYNLDIFFIEEETSTKANSNDEFLVGFQ